MPPKTAKSRTPAKKNRYSRPVYDYAVTVQSEYAQRPLRRNFYVVVSALYAIEVIMRITGDEAVLDQVEEIVDRLIDQLMTELKAETGRLDKVIEDHAVRLNLRYENPMSMTVHVSSPQLAKYTRLIEEFDRLMVATDTLWLGGVFTNKQRANGAYTWRNKLTNAGQEIVKLANRARASVRRSGREEDIQAVDEALAEQQGELALSADDDVPEAQEDAKEAA
jgi:hypothetical protein